MPKKSTGTRGRKKKEEKPKKTKATKDKKSTASKSKAAKPRPSRTMAARDTKPKRGVKKSAARAAASKRDPTKKAGKAGAGKKDKEASGEPVLDKRGQAILKFFQKNGAKTRETLFNHNYSDKTYRPDSLNIVVLRDIQGKGADRVYVEVRCTWDIPESEETGPAHAFHEGVEVWVKVKNDGFKVNVTWDFVRPDEVLEQYRVDDFE